MKTTFLVALIFVVALAPARSSGQTNFVYDQQSAIEGAAAEGGGSIPINHPLGQSFIPTLNFVDFVRLRMDDVRPGNGTGAVVYVDLLANSISGTVLASSIRVSLPDSFGTATSEYPNFFFSNSVPVTPGVTFYFRPTLLSGDPVNVVADVTYQYTRGTAFGNGVAVPTTDLWFREGIITVPEPSVVALGAVGVAVWVGWRVRRARKA